MSREQWAFCAMPEQVLSTPQGEKMRVKGYVKYYSNTLDSSRERVAFRIFCVLLFFK